MNRVVVNARNISLPSWSGSAGKYAKKVLNKLQKNDWELSIVLCDDNTITALNGQYRNKNEPTDILSFNLGETVKKGKKKVYLPGDIVISLETLRENAQYFQISEDEELRRLIIHGILHLDGMDHCSVLAEYSALTEQDSVCKQIKTVEPMLAFQEEILNRLKNEHIIPSQVLTAKFPVSALHGDKN